MCGFNRIVTRYALEKQPFHFRQRGAAREIVGILLALMSMAMDVDGVFDFDMRRMHDAGFVLRARCVGGDAPFVRRGRNNILGHGFLLLCLMKECCYRLGEFVKVFKGGNRHQAIGK